MIFLVFLTSQLTFAQNVKIDQVEPRVGETTTIQIKKSATIVPVAPIGGEASSQVKEGVSEIVGDSALLKSEAKKKWKKACARWEKKFRKDNKSNKIIDLNCGKPKCSGTVTEKTCVSSAKYTIQIMK